MSFIPKITRRLHTAMRTLVDSPQIRAREVIRGRGIVIESGVEIVCDRLVLGDGVVIRAGGSMSES